MKRNILALAAFSMISLGALAQVDRSKQPATGPAPEVKLEAPKQFTLPNGMRVMVVENHKLPRASALLTLDNYPQAESPKTGVSDLAGELFGNGTTKMDKDAFNERIDFLGARASFWSTGARVSSLSKYFPEMLNLMADAVLKPVFLEEEFKKTKDQMIEGLKSNEKSASAIAGNVVDALTYGRRHPFGEFSTISSVEKVTFQDAKNHLKVHFKPNHAYLVIIGDVKYAKVKAQITKLFGKWAKKVEGRTFMPKVKNAVKTEINFVDVPNAVQSEIALTNTFELKKSHPDYFPLIIANQIYGGDFSSYLNMNIREAHGWTYGARSSFSASRYIGTFQASTQVRNSVTDSTIMEAMKEMDRILTEDVSQEDIDRVKAKYSGNFVMSVQKPNTIARYAMDIERLGLGKDFYKNFLKNLNAVTVADIKRVAKKYFLKDNMRIIVVGKGSEVAEGLEKLGYPIKYYNKKAKRIKKPVFKKSIPEGMTAQIVIDNLHKAMGGKDKLKNTKSVFTVYTAKMQGMLMTARSKAMAPNLSLSTMDVNGQPMQSQKFDGKKAKTILQGKVQENTEEELKKMQESTQPFNELDLKGKLESIETVNEKECYVLVDEDKKYFIDTETYLILKQSTKIEGPNGETTTQSVIFGDYKEVKGIQFPNKMSITFGPRSLDFTAQKIEVDSKSVKKKDFKI
ncbi:MAG: insulinase family protein [Flavobacteriales bacterium]|jgi:predicted Zn-dependent peptidase|nr:insulinase family protein [Flavobacteriales bacterium]